MQNNCMDKIVLKFLADVLYLKKVICFEEYKAILDSHCPDCLDNIIEDMLCDKYNPYTRGELNGE